MTPTQKIELLTRRAAHLEGCLLRIDFLASKPGVKARQLVAGIKIELADARLASLADPAAGVSDAG